MTRAARGQLVAPRLEASDLAAVERIEAFTLTAVPARTSWELPGWWCVADDGGHVGRANSATAVPCVAGTEPAHLHQVADSYRQRGLPAKVRWTPVAPSSVATDIASHGWRAAGEVLVMVGETTRLSAAARLGADDPGAAHSANAVGRPPTASTEHTSLLLAEPDAAWSDVYLNANADGSGPARLRLAREAPRPKVYARIEVAGATAAIGLGIVMDGMLGIFDVVTAPRFRRKGHAGRLMRLLLGWGAEQGAGTVFLQVHGGNEPAKALYSAIGFTTGYTYLYLTQDQG